jgi:peptidoglycan hydrolase CwlO-like protein
MSEKRVVSRKVAIALGIICVLLIVGFVGAVANYSSIISEKDLQIASLNSQIAVKDAEIQSLRSQIDSLNNAVASLNSEIRNKISEISSLESEIVKLNVSYLSLESDYLSLKSEYDSLKQDYEKLLSAIEKGEVAAKSATWLSEDKRLKVTSEVIPELLLGELWCYTVKVTVTNVGTEPINTVWILLFPYKNDKLIEGWSPLSYSKKVESLYIGESYSYNFTWVPKEMTTYKVVVVAG